jgi:hypothetical protein
VTAAAAAALSFLRHILEPHSSKQMTVIQESGVKWVVNLLQLNLGYACDLFTSRVQSQEINTFFLGISYR